MMVRKLSYTIYDNYFIVSDTTILEYHRQSYDFLGHYLRQPVWTILDNFLGQSRTAILKNTGLAALGAFPHRLQRHTEFKIQNGH